MILKNLIDFILYKEFQIFFQGDHLNIEPSASIEECWNFCQNATGCTWFSHSAQLQDCFLFDTCPELKPEKDFITSQVECVYNSNSESHK